MNAFRLSKWYMDCVSEDGETIVLYTARLRWRAITLHYGNLLIRPPGEPPRSETTMRAQTEPSLAGDVLAWSSPALGVSARWSSLEAPAEATMFDSTEGTVAWRCLGARARAEITLGDRVVRGLGYAEHLVLTIEPWRLPIDELRWGRFVGERSSLVWIDWRGPHEKQLVLLDGKAVGRTTIDDRSVVADGVKLDIDPGGELRRGAIGGTALARVPGLDRFPTRILALDEQKWCARATLEDAHGKDRGFAIHEVVRWPAREETRAPSHALGKILYGLLFAAVLPALLALWARATESTVTAAACHSPRLGAALAIAGALLVLAGWLSLWRDGGGLPMNAFPPPRLVTRGPYALVAHPIYVGFGAICFGVSIATGSASGLWLVSPTVALAAAALVLGYERQDLESRFGRDRGAPWIGLPRELDASPTFARRVSTFFIAFFPWILLAARETWPAVDLRDALVFALALAAPFWVTRERDLRTVAVRSLLAMPLVVPMHALVPSLTPSFSALAALLAADAFTAHRPWTRWIARAAAVVIATGELTSVLATIIAYTIVLDAGEIWRGLRALAELVANSWHETRLGPLRIINHGIWAALASFGGILIIGSLVGPGHFAMLVVGAAGGLVGAGIWAQTIEGSAALSRPFGFYGGLLGICAAALLAPWLGTPIWLLLGAVAVAGPYIQGVGRLRCLVQGCCHGSETSALIGIRYHHPRSRVCRLAHLDGVPIHPTPLYSTLWNMVTFVLVARLWSLHAPLHLIGGVYLIANGLGRFVEEAYRGEPQTPIYARLRLYQWAALAQVLAGALVTALGSSPGAPPVAPNVDALLAASIFGVIYGLAMGVDFPSSNRRLSRLA
ncbi:MAG TPA: prolipoprotein diacylglyceryl transferase family protein [Polyangiaceae bacterium]|jgi:protein-S-isoprenylcysteine O-methyltransferase Ste14